MSGMPGTRRAAEQDTEPPNHDIGGGLYGITAAQKAFLFLDGPADVLRVATACQRWRELACAGSVWRAKAEREGILEKAAAFEVESPAALDEGEGGGGAALGHEEGSGTWLAFYARVFALEVRRGHACRLVSRGARLLHLFASPHAPTHTHLLLPPARRCVHRGTG